MPPKCCKLFICKAVRLQQNIHTKSQKQKNVWRSDKSWELETLSHSFILSLSLEMLYNFHFHVLEDNMNIGASIQQFQRLYSTIRESSWKCQNDFFIPSQLLEKKLAMCNQESTNWQDTPIIAVTCSDLMAEPRDKLACICKNISE